MAKNDAPKTETAAKDAAPQAETPAATIRWDGSNMRSTYANVCNVSSSREEMTLLFGTNRNWHSGQTELTIELTDRMILNPYAAKRLAILLMNTVQQYEKRFGELQLDLPETNAE